MNGPTLISVLRIPKAFMSMNDAWDSVRLSNSDLRCSQDSSEVVYFGQKNSNLEEFGLCITVQDTINDGSPISGAVYLNR